MATFTQTTIANPLDFDLHGTLAGYWVAVLRVVTGYWFLHSGITKFAFVSGEPFSAQGYLVNVGASSPIQGFLVWAGQTPWMVEFANVMVPVGEALIGLGLVVGALVRLASLFGGVLMTFFYLGNASWAHGFVNGDLMGLLLFVTLGVLGAGRVLGLDAVLEQTRLGQTRAAKYLLG
ncbi:DoxX family protein [Halobellus captivus]|uniref:DoxX family protein n=1 Tax=Halobellus captivus TaxID=2592614 RepID=UPI0011A214F3|nr:DoxX family protein [Halobellus captivus]